MADLPEPSSGDGPAGPADATLLRIKCQGVIIRLAFPPCGGVGKRQIEGWEYVIPGGGEGKFHHRVSCTLWLLKNCLLMRSSQ